MPDPILATSRVKFTSWNRNCPPARPATYAYAVSMSGNGVLAGQTSCAAYTSTDASTPVIKQTRTVASQIFLRGFSTSSDSVESPSKPMYVRTAIEVPVNRAEEENVAGS